MCPHKTHTGSTQWMAIRSSDGAAQRPTWTFLLGSTRTCKTTDLPAPTTSTGASSAQREQLTASAWTASLRRSRASSSSPITWTSRPSHSEAGPCRGRSGPCRARQDRSRGRGDCFWRSSQRPRPRVCAPHRKPRWRGIPQAANRPSNRHRGASSQLRARSLLGAVVSVVVGCMSSRSMSL